MTFWVAFVVNVFGRFQRNFAHFTVVTCAKFCCGRSSTASNSGREIWPRPFTRKQMAKISTPGRQPWHRRLMFPQSVNEPVTSPRTVLTYPDRRPLSLYKPKCNRFNYCERPSLSWFGHRHQSAIFTCCDAQEPAQKRWATTLFHVLIMCSTN